MMLAKRCQVNNLRLPQLKMLTRVYMLIMKSLSVGVPQEPLGKLEQKEDDAGPTTGHRRMPDAVDAEGRDRPRLPSHLDNAEELRKEVQSRNGSL